MEVLNLINQKANRARIPRNTDLSEESGFKDFSQYAIKTFRAGGSQGGFKTLRF